MRTPSPKEADRGLHGEGATRAPEAAVRRLLDEAEQFAEACRTGSSSPLTRGIDAPSLLRARALLVSAGLSRWAALAEESEPSLARREAYERAYRSLVESLAGLGAIYSSVFSPEEAATFIVDAARRLDVGAGRGGGTERWVVNELSETVDGAIRLSSFRALCLEILRAIDRMEASGPSVRKGGAPEPAA